MNNGGVIEVRRCNGISGEVSLPGDKSISHRAVIIASISKGESIIDGILTAQDVVSTIGAFKMMGVDIGFIGDKRVRVRGNGLWGLKEPCDVIDAGNSGTTLRLLTGLLSPQRFFSVITGDDSLRRRPMKRVVEPLSAMGARIWGREEGAKAPLAILGNRLSPITYTLPVASAQVKTAIILAGLYTEGETVIIEKTPSRNHTEIMLGYRGAGINVEDGRISIQGGTILSGGDYRIPGDPSSAAFLVVAALILPDSRLILKDICINPTRTGFIDVLLRMGADISIENRREWNGEPVGDIYVRSSSLKATTIGGEDIPRTIDELPVLCIAASCAQGRTVIKDAAELRVKESDRIAVMVEELRRFGIEVEEMDDGLEILGSDSLEGADCHSHGDHRVAMSLYVAGLIANGSTRIHGTECVDTSFPDFFEIMEGLRG